MTDSPPPIPAELRAGVVTEVSPLVRRIVAPNPSRMTGPGTNTYLVGRDEVTVIDPGPDIESHLDAIEAAGAGAIRWIVCTHTHPDHWPGAPELAKRTSAPVLAWGNRGGLKVDQRIRDGFELPTDEYTLRAVHTPGHASNHLCYLLADESLLFSGDHIMEGSTVVIRPPDGDMGAYLESLRKVRALGLRAIAPGHGLVIGEPDARIDWYLSHRLEREAQLHSVLVELGSARISEIVRIAYAEVHPDLVPMARHSAHAHLRKLADDGRVEGKGLRGVWTAR